MNIQNRWVPESEEWKAAAKLVSMRQYQRCLDTLEGLVVARMFELTRMNMSQTGRFQLPSVHTLMSHCHQAITYASTSKML